MTYLKTLELDETGDLLFSDLKKPESVSGSKKPPQDLRVLLKTQKGEHPTNPDFGVDWLRIKTTPKNDELIRSEIEGALVQYPWYKSLEDVIIGEPDENRELPITVKVVTSEDEVITVGVAA